MNHCEVCGNKYDNMFEVKFKKDGIVHWFDCFECAIHKLTPQCEHCGVKILGHGVQAENHLYCGAHCARTQGFNSIVDRVQNDDDMFAYNTI